MKKTFLVSLATLLMLVSMGAGCGSRTTPIPSTDSSGSGGLKLTDSIKSVTIGIPVKNLKETTDWYRKLFPNREELVPMEGMWELSITPSVWLQLFESDIQESSSKSINFETTDIKKSRELVIDLGVKAGEIQVIPDTVQYFEFSDPFGNKFSFVQLFHEKD